MRAAVAMVGTKGKQFRVGQRSASLARSEKKHTVIARLFDMGSCERIIHGESN